MPRRGRSWWSACAALAIASTAVAPSSAMAHSLISRSPDATTCGSGSCGSGGVHAAIPNTAPVESSPGTATTRTLPSSPAEPSSAILAVPSSAAPTTEPNAPSPAGTDARASPPPGAGPAQGGESGTGSAVEPTAEGARTGSGAASTGDMGSTSGWSSAYSPSTGHTPSATTTGTTPRPSSDDVASPTQVGDVAPSTPTTPRTAPPPTSGSGTTAAETYGWGAPSKLDDFTAGALPGWGLYDGAGHSGKGRRSPSAVVVRDGVLTITGSADGTTGGMAWGPGQRYGRWEGRVRTPVGDGDYHSLLLLWPDAEDWPRGGEADFMEISDPSRRSTDGFLHYGANNSQLSASVAVDATQWHNWAVEWTPTRLTYFVDGRAWFTTTRTDTLPPGPMHLCVQLDWFPSGGRSTPSSMQVDWVRYYPLR